MKIRITALISFAGSILIGLFILSEFAKLSGSSRSDFLLFMLWMIYSFSTILYVIWTTFGKTEITPLEKIELENQLLLKQVEQKELLKRLDQ